MGPWARPDRTGARSELHRVYASSIVARSPSARAASARLARNGIPPYGQRGPPKLEGPMHRPLPCAALAAALAACGSSDRSAAGPVFGDGFEWGSATAAY